MFGFNEEPANNWMSGLLLGNGEYGVMIHGNINEEQITVSHHHSFLKTKNMNKIPFMADLLAELRDIIVERNYKEAIDFFEKKAIERGYPGLTMSDYFHPIYSLEVKHAFNKPNKTFKSYSDHPEKGHIKGDYITKKYDLSKGYLSVSYRTDVISSMTVRFEGFKKEGIIEEGKVLKEGLIYKLKYFDDTGFQSVLSVQTDGEIKISTDSLQIINYTETKMDIETLHNEESFYVQKKEVKSYLKLCESSTLSNEKLLQNIYKHDHKQIFLTRMYQNSVKYIQAYSGFGIPNLQGIWSGDFEPAWAGDYTFDTNVQLAISSYLSLGMFGEMKSVFKHLENMFDDFRHNAQYYFGCKGLLVPAHASRRGLHLHWDKDWPLVFWISGAGWLSKYYQEYFNYTEDYEFLRKQALPFFEESLEFYMDYVQVTNDKILIRPSYSAENGMGDNSTMDIMIIRDLIKNIINARNILNLPQDETVYNFEKKLPKYLIENNVLREWVDKETVENYNHRHFSHLYGVFETKEINKTHYAWEASRNAFKKRLDHWFYNCDRDTSSVHGKIHTGFLAIAFEMDNVFDDVLQSIMNNQNYFKNFVTSHYDWGEVFNLDGSGAYPKLIIDSLIYVEYDESITIRKIKSNLLSEGIITNVFLPKNLKVNHFKWYDNTWEMSLSSTQNMYLKINDDGETKAIHINEGENLIRKGD